MKINSKISVLLAGSLALFAGGISYAAEEGTAIQVIPSEKLAVYAPAAEISFTVKNLTGDARYQVLNYEREVVEEATLGKEGALTLQQSLPNGYYDLTLTVAGADGQPVQEFSYPFAVIPEFDASKIDWAKNQFGAMVQPHGNYSYEDRERDAKFMERIGMRFVRSARLSWDQVQMAPDQPYNFAHADWEIDMYHKHNLEVITNLGWTAMPSFYQPDEDSSYYPPEHIIEKLEAYLTEVGKRYRGKIKYYEIGNEVDAALFWKGRKEHYDAGDKDAIIADFAELYTRMAKAVRQGDPDAQCGPNTTGAAPDGTTYRQWLPKFLSNEAARNEMDFFSSHYMADLPEIQKVLAEYGKGDVDVIFTEIGGMAIVMRKVPTWEEKCSNIRLSYIQYGAQLTHNGKALCKFLLRDIPNYPAVGWIAGMLEDDFRIRPEYVGMGTMIRMLAGSDPAGELNVTKDADKGWLQGYAFDRNGERINMLILRDTPDANITLRSPEKELTITDAMGRESQAAVKDGTAVIPMSAGNPIFVTGTIEQHEGAIEYPKPKVIFHEELDVNGTFELTDTGKNDIPKWKFVTDTGASEIPEGVKAYVDTTTGYNDNQSACISVENNKGWYALMFELPLDRIPRLKAGQFIEIKVSYYRKGENVAGTGTTMAVSIRDENFKRLSYSDTRYTWGTFDWEKVEELQVINSLPKECKYITVEFFHGMATGKLWFDDIKIDVTVSEKSGAEAAYVN